MDCPRCHRALRAIRYEGVAVDTCDGCGGEWLDKAEILLINRARGAVFSEQERSRVEGAQNPVVTASSSARGEMKCPVCKVLLKTFNYAYDSGVIVDQCPKCEGLWLDKGELESLQIVVEEWEKRNPEIRKRFASTLSNIQTKEDLEREVLINGVAQKHIGPGPLKSILKAILYQIF